VIECAEASTFLIDIGVGDPGEPGADVRGRRLLLEAVGFF
jgi:hypothetical protein